MLINRLTIRGKLLLMAATNCLLLAVLGGLSVHNLQQSNGAMERVAQELEPNAHLAEMFSLMRESRAQLLLAMMHDPSRPESAQHDHPVSVHLDAVGENARKLSSMWEAFVAVHNDEEDFETNQAFEQARGRFVKEGIQPVRAALEQGDYAQANHLLLTQLNPLFQPAAKAIQELIDFQLREAADAQQWAKDEYADDRATFIALVIAGIAAALLLSFAIARGIQRAVGAISAASGGLAQGDLTTRANYSAPDELGDVAAAFNHMADGFSSAIREVAQATDQLAAAAEETATVSQQTSSGVSQQQSEIQQAAAAINQMSASVNEVARSAQQAADAASSGNAAALDGKRLIDQTVALIDVLAGDVTAAGSAVEALQLESEHIGGVLDVIRGVADQTNLLALNAAIEAARAGEMGRGFAVVADEVRTLASRTQQSTQEIHGMIERLQSGASNAVAVMQRSGQRARESVDQTRRAGESFESILGVIATINDMNNQVASASEEQSAVAEEINRKISSISVVTEQTAAGAQHTSSASGELARLAERLSESIRHFRTG